MIRPLAAVCALAVALSPAAGARRAAGLAGIDRLAADYDLILDARFAEAERALPAACGPRPGQAAEPACEVLGATATWWHILLNPEDQRLDPTFVAQADRAVDGCERWTDRAPDDAEAWFYLGAAYGIRVSWKVQRGERVSAARDGKHVKEALERALELEPGLQDARFGIGLYKYYADIAPAFAKILRFLLLLPGGDRVQGLRDMEAVHAQGQLLRGEADYQLHWIYLWYEHKSQRARDLLVSLRARYPDNPHFVERLAIVDRDYFHDHAGSLADWEVLVTGAAHMGDPLLAETSGRLGASEELDALFETDQALQETRQVIAHAPERPYGARARALLLEGRWLDQLGQRPEAVAAYKAALDAVPDRDPDHVASQARTGLDRVPDQDMAAAYRTSLRGWRAYQRGALDEAESLMARAHAASPRHAMIQARYGRVLQARHRTDEALAAFDEVIARRAEVSPIAVTAAWRWSAELLESRGDLAGARTRYRAATSVFAGDSRLAREAARALDRLEGR